MHYILSRTNILLPKYVHEISSYYIQDSIILDILLKPILFYLMVVIVRIWRME